MTLFQSPRVSYYPRGSVQRSGGFANLAASDMGEEDIVYVAVG